MKTAPGMSRHRSSQAAAGDTCTIGGWRRRENRVLTFLVKILSDFTELPIAFDKIISLCVL